MMNRWWKKPDDATSCTPDVAIATKFHETFAEPLSSSKKPVMHELFPMHGACWARAATGSD